MKLFRAVVKWPRGGVEHVFEDVTVAARKDEQTVVHGLDIAAEQGLHVFLGIIGDLLKFVNGEDAGFVGFLQIVEDFLEGELGVVDVAQFDVKRRCSRTRVVTQTSCQRFDGVEEEFQGPFSFWNQIGITT